MTEHSDPDCATYVSGLIGRIEPFDNRPRAEKVLLTDSAHVVIFQFGAGHELREHAAQHPVIIQALSGHVEFSYDDQVVGLGPGDLVHLPPMKRHSAVATEPTTLSVTMLLGGPAG